MRPITDMCNHVAIFLDDSGRHVGRKTIPYGCTSFTFNHKGYFNRPLDCTVVKVGSFMNWTKQYYYFVSDPNPITFVRNYIPLISAEDIGQILESDAIKKINAFASPNKFLEFITNPIVLIVLGIVSVLIWWISQHGGKLF
jgi:hypothetical protein